MRSPCLPLITCARDSRKADRNIGVFRADRKFFISFKKIGERND